MKESVFNIFDKMPSATDFNVPKVNSLELGKNLLANQQKTIKIKDSVEW